MPIANVRGVSLNYEILGDRGPAMALTPGGRNPIANVRPYAEQMAAQGYRESQLDQSRRSQAGAIGIMQLLPATAADPKVGIADITEAEANVHAGVRYLNFLRTHYFDDPAIDRLNQTLLALAAYNAGPARTRGLREMAAAEGLDPNRWFNNVEVVIGEQIGMETTTYVRNIYKYYVAYRLIADARAAADSARQQVNPGGITPTTRNERPLSVMFSLMICRLPPN